MLHAPRIQREKRPESEARSGVQTPENVPVRKWVKGDQRSVSGAYSIYIGVSDYPARNVNTLGRAVDRVHLLF